ncbi:GNAT family N-acetyltransferase [Bradyrhizobium sp. ISRA435]|nr:GNAT family N-acetyltransferase [Bradyrhizobium sp. ISRA435]
MSTFAIKPLDDAPPIRSALGELLVETVASGGSVSFMHPLPFDDACAFWRDSLGSAARGERVVLGAFDGEALIGTVTLLLKLAPNQPHRAEIAKMMTRLSHRHRGVATALMRAAEQLAVAHGRTLLVLDTAVDDGAAPLYEKLGFQLTGIIPDYALKPHGGLTGTMIYWKRIGDARIRAPPATKAKPLRGSSGRRGQCPARAA